MSGTLDDPTLPPPSGATGQGLAGALLAPGAEALLGLAGGLAQAAMPRPYKMPFGAVLGMAAQGVNQGLASSAALQHASLENQSAAMANRLAASRIPLFQQMIAARLGQNAGSMPAAPFGVPRPMTGAGGAGATGLAGSAPQGALGGGVGRPAVNPGQMLSDGVTMGLLGNDGLGAAMVKAGQEESGGAGWVANTDGTTGFVPHGPQDPTVIARTKGIEAGASATGNLMQQGYGRLADGSFGIIPGGPADPAMRAAQASAENLARNGLQPGPNGSVVPMPGYQAGISGNAAAQSAGAAAGKAPYDEPIQYDAIGPNGAVQHFTVPRTTYAAGAGSGNAPPQPVPAATWAGKVSSLESGNNPTATSQVSTAGGSGQFLNGTWNAFLQAQHPELMNTANPAALKANPQLMQEATVWLARQNAGTLAQTGAPVNAATLALAHRIGGQGAADVLAAPTNTPLAAIPSLRGAMSLDPRTGQPINPDLQGQTAGRLAGNYLLRFGNRPVDLSSGANGAPPQGPLGGVAGAPIMTDEQKAISAQYGAAAAANMQAAQKAPVVLQKLDIISNAADQFQPSAYGANRLGAARNFAAAIQGLGMTPPKWLVDGAAAGETIGKEGMQLAIDLTKTLGTREAASVLNSIKGVMPNISMSNGGAHVIVAALKQVVQRDQDLGAFQDTWLQSHPSIAGMQAEFDRQKPPEAYASRVIPFPPPKSGAPLVPNVYYRNSGGQVALWDGSAFQPVGR